MKRALTVLLFITIASSYLFSQVPVTFNVDMSIQVKKGLFDLTTGTVKLAGTLTDWGNGALLMEKTPGNDSLFTITVDTINTGDNIEEGDTLFFKFIKGANSWESIDDRRYIVTAGTNEFTAYFENDSIYDPTVVKVDVAVSFICDMSLEIASGNFNPETDTLQVRGDFNGWSSTSIMDPASGSSYTFDTTLSLGVGDAINYKYVYATSAGLVWESGDNRVGTVTEADTTARFLELSRGFNDLNLEDVIAQPATILFTVNMDGAINTDLDPDAPFDTIQNVILCGATLPLQWPEAGWPSRNETDSTKVIFMFNDGTNGDVAAGDDIWSVEVTFPQYTNRTIEYKYGANFGFNTVNTDNDNESATSDNHYFNMAVNLTGGTAVDTFGSMGSKELTDPQVGVEDEFDAAPKAYALNQNYPNPFNPSTVIRYSIPENAFVTLKVYNLLGQEVAQLVNSEQAAKSYEVSFDASKLTSGVYFYTIKAGSFMSTKKMIFLK